MGSSQREKSCVSSKQNNCLLDSFHFFSNTPYCTTCSAEEDVEILFFPKRLIFTLLKSTGTSEPART